MTTYFREWIQKRTRIAQRLADGEIEGTYLEATLILGAVISGLASELWPGKQRDRHRFVEAWTRFSDASLGADRIALPLLIDFLEARDRGNLSARLRDTHHAFSLWNDTLLVSGADVDLPAHSVESYLPEIRSREIRRFSYGSQFYEHVRSGLVHEYRIGETVSTHAMAKDGSGVSYVNTLIAQRVTRRQLHFEVAWIASLVESLSEKVEPYVDEGRSLPVPGHWWLDGG